MYFLDIESKGMHDLNIILVSAHLRNMFPASCLALSPIKTSEGENDCYLCNKDNITVAHMQTSLHTSKLKIYHLFLRVFRLLELDAFAANLTAGTYLFMLKYILTNKIGTIAIEGKYFPSLLMFNRNISYFPLFKIGKILNFKQLKNRRFFFGFRLMFVNICIF